jgi:hypothetical protein
MSHKEGLHNLHISSDIIRMMTSRNWNGQGIWHAWDKNAYKVKPEGISPLGRLKHRWKDNIKVNLKEMECEGMDWIHLAQDRD